MDTTVQDENVYPKLELKDVAFTMDSKSFVINTQGDLPIYKSHKFEEGIKAWITNELTSYEKGFMQELQRSEREIMNTFAFKKDIELNKHVSNVLGRRTAHSSLSEVMRLDGDHVVLDFLTEFEGADLQETSKSMRHI